MIIIQLQVQRKRVTVPVPAGVEDNQTMRMAVGKKELFITFKVEKSNYFRRDGADVHTEANVSLAQAVLGGTIRIQGVYEDHTIQVVPGTSSHTRICLSNKGLRRVNSYGQGHHYVNTKIVVPKKLSEKQRALLQAYAELEEDTPGQILGVVQKKDGKSSDEGRGSSGASSGGNSGSGGGGATEPLSDKYTQKAADEPVYEKHDRKGSAEYKKAKHPINAYFMFGFAGVFFWWLIYTMSDPVKVYEMSVPKEKRIYDDTDLKR